MLFTDHWRLRIDWWIQNHLTWSPPAPSLPPLDQQDFITRLSRQAQRRLRELNGRFAIHDWQALCTAATFHCNLYTLDICDRYLGATPSTGRALDVGCKDWEYLPALTTWSGLSWDGVEIDAYRRHINLLTRRAYGERMATAFVGCRYLPGSVTELREKYSLITWFLPFVRRAPLRAWRLPDRLFQPEALLTHVYGLLEPGGRLLIINQGAAETTTQQRLFTAQGIRADSLGWIESPLSPFREKRHGWLVHRQGCIDGLDQHAGAYPLGDGSGGPASQG